MMETLKKWVPRVVLLIACIGMAYFGFHTAETQRKYSELIGIKEKYEQLDRYTAKLETEYKDAQAINEAAERMFKNVIKNQEERINLLSDATFLMSRHVSKQDGPDYFFETKGRTRNYVFNEVRLAGPDSPPIGFVMIKHDGRTYKGNYAFEIQVKTMVTREEETGRVHVYSKAFLVGKEDGLAGKRRPDFKKWAGVEYPLDIVGGSVIVDPTMPVTDPPRFLKWAPHLNGGLNFGLDDDGANLRPELSFSTSGYGRSRNDLDWKFLHLGIGTDTDLKNPDIHLMPFTYRIVPKYLTNTYLGPGVGWSRRGGVNYFINTSLTF